MTPAPHDKKLQGAMNFRFRTLAFISVAAVYALSTFGDQVPTLSLSLSLSPPCATTLQPCLSSALTFLWAATLCAPRA